MTRILSNNVRPSSRRVVFLVIMTLLLPTTTSPRKHTRSTSHHHHKNNKNNVASARSDHVATQAATTHEIMDSPSQIETSHHLPLATHVGEDTSHKSQQNDPQEAATTAEKEDAVAAKLATAHHPKHPSAKHVAVTQEIMDSHLAKATYKPQSSGVVGVAEDGGDDDGGADDGDGGGNFMLQAAETIALSAILGFLFLLCCLCCCVRIQRRKKIQQSQKRTMQILKSLRHLDSESKVDVRVSAAGGFHGTLQKDTSRSSSVDTPRHDDDLMFANDAADAESVQSDLSESHAFLQMHEDGP